MLWLNEQRWYPIRYMQQQGMIFRPSFGFRNQASGQCVVSGFFLPHSSFVFYASSLRRAQGTAFRWCTRPCTLRNLSDGASFHVHCFTDRAWAERDEALPQTQTLFSTDGVNLGIPQGQNVWKQRHEGNERHNSILHEEARRKKSGKKTLAVLIEVNWLLLVVLNQTSVKERHAQTTLLYWHKIHCTTNVGLTPMKSTIRRKVLWLLLTWIL